MASMIMFLMTVTMVMSVTMCMVSIVSEYESTNSIDKKSEYSDDESYIIVYGKGWNESLYGKPSYKESHNAQKYSTCICSKYLYLPSAKRKLRITYVLSGKYIRKKRDSESKSMCSHMPSISKESHGIRDPTDNNLHNHRESGNDKDDECASFGICFNRIKVMGMFSMSMLHKLIFSERIILVYQKNNRKQLIKEDSSYILEQNYMFKLHRLHHIFSYFLQSDTVYILTKKSDYMAKIIFLYYSPIWVVCSVHIAQVFTFSPNFYGKMHLSEFVHIVLL